MNEINLFLVVLIGVLQIGDVLTTEKILGNGGKELNPIMNWLFTKFGMHKVLIIKSIVSTEIAFFAGLYSPDFLIPIAVFCTAVVVWNLNVIRKMK
jgi:hypothetical protein